MSGGHISSLWAGCGGTYHTLPSWWVKAGSSRGCQSSLHFTVKDFPAPQVQGPPTTSTEGRSWGSAMPTDPS